jgi:hypothetical protein
MADNEVKSFSNLEKQYSQYRQKLALMDHVINCPRHALDILKKYPDYECRDTQSAIGRALIRLSKHQSSNGIM